MSENYLTYRRSNCYPVRMTNKRRFLSLLILSSSLYVGCGLESSGGYVPPPATTFPQKCMAWDPSGLVMCDPGTPGMVAWRRQCTEGFEIVQDARKGCDYVYKDGKQIPKEQFPGCTVVRNLEIWCYPSR